MHVYAKSSSFINILVRHLVGLLAKNGKASVVHGGSDAGVREEGIKWVDNQLRARSAHPQRHIRLGLVDFLVFEDPVGRRHLKMMKVGSAGWPDILLLTHPPKP